MTSPARSHAAGLGIQTVPITNCAVIQRTHIEDAWIAGQQRAAARLGGLV